MQGIGSIRKIISRSIVYLFCIVPVGCVVQLIPVIVLSRCVGPVPDRLSVFCHTDIGNYGDCRNSYFLKLSGDGDVITRHCEAGAKLILQLAQEELDGLHILLVTRDTSGIDFVELLSKGLCCILSRRHLKFTDSEIQDYCRMRVDGITDADLSKICEYTDGWISLVYILLLGLESGIPVGMSTIIEEMVEKALFTPYDRQMQDFLLKLSVMEEFTTEQSEYVTGNENAGQLLKKLHRNNSFVFYDEKNRTYKIHSVLLDYLRMKRNFTAEETHFKNIYQKLGVSSKVSAIKLAQASGYLGTTVQFHAQS